jgi:hypothetical protein
MRRRPESVLKNALKTLDIDEKNYTIRELKTKISDAKNACSRMTSVKESAGISVPEFLDILPSTSSGCARQRVDSTTYLSGR